MARSRRGVGAVAIGAVLAATILTGCDPAPAPLVVTSSGTGGDTAPGDGACVASAGGCTLRAAIEEANAAPALSIVTVAAGVAPSLGGATVPITASLELRGGGAALHDRLLHTGGTLTVRDLTVSEVATPSGCGGAINSTGTSLVLERVVVRANSTGGNHGGGVCTNAPVTLIDSHVTGNEVLGAASGTGGGVRTSSTLTIVRSTIEGNRTPAGLGTEISVAGSGPLTVATSTVASTSTTGSTVLAPVAQGTVVASTLPTGIAVSTAVHARGSVLAGCAPSGAPTLGGYNLVGDGCGTPGATDRTGPAALDGLWPVARPTPTMAPSVAGNLVDAIPPGTTGLCEAGARDQRDRPRPAGAACDIGAVERQTTITAGPSAPLDTVATPGIVRAVSDAGVAVGETPSRPPQVLPDALRWAPDGTRTTLAYNAAAYDVDEAGYVVGTQLTGPNSSIAVRWSPTGVAAPMTPLAGDSTSEALAIDDAGRIYGRSARPGASQAWWRAADLGPPTVLESFGRTHADIVDDDEHGSVLGKLSTDGAAPEWVVWDVPGGSTVRLPSSLPAAGAGLSYTAIDEASVYGSVTRPDLGNACPDEYGNVCTVTHAFRLDLTTGEVTTLPSHPGPFSRVIDVDDRGRALVASSSFSYGCTACPVFATSIWVVDVASGEVTSVGTTGEGDAVIGDDGLVILTGTLQQFGEFLPAPYRVVTTGGRGNPDARTQGVTITG